MSIFWLHLVAKVQIVTLQGHANDDIILNNDTATRQDKHNLISTQCHYLLFTLQCFVCADVIVEILQRKLS